MPRRGKRFQPHMQRSGMWGQWNDTDKGVLKERPALCVAFCICIVLAGLSQRHHSDTPHSAALHVGLKSPIPSELGQPYNPQQGFKPC
ncbi:hypothetical protein Barb6XT_00129 [Bacteroidales bacterium Barb6XT]|nr:hypothetical protein Barb6XT_00129 [Bacteroidales bacterium Barb6XT]